MNEKKWQITSSPWGFRFFSMERYCSFMKECGITGICCMLGEPGEFRLSVAPTLAAAKEARLIAEDSGVRILETAGAGDLEKNIFAAKEMGVEFYRICEIIPDTLEDRKKFTAYLKEAGKIAGDLGIRVIVENHGGLMTKAVSCREILKDVAMSNVKLNYDPANFLYYGQDPLTALDCIIHLIGFTHFKNLKYIDGSSEFCRLRDGAINYSQILDRLLPLYDGIIGLEYESADNAQEGTVDDLTYIRKLLERYA